MLYITWMDLKTRRSVREADAKDHTACRSINVTCPEQAHSQAGGGLVGDRG